MANEYIIRLAKSDVGGFSQSPDQKTSNAGSPDLMAKVKAKNKIVFGLAAMQTKRVVGKGFQALTGELGISELEQTMADAGKLVGIGALALFSFPVAGIAVGGEMFINTIGIAVDTHRLNLENEVQIKARGTRRNSNAGGYYG